MNARRAAEAHRLALAVKALRAEWLDALEHHQAHVEGQVREVLEALETLDPVPGGPRPPPLRDVPRFDAVLARGAGVKPQKGRAKDLRRVEQVVADLVGLLDR